MYIIILANTSFSDMFYGFDLTQTLCVRMCLLRVDIGLIPGA